MAESNSVRKRKRPPYLDEFFASLAGEVPVAKKKVAGNEESEQDCELCSNITESSAIVWDLLAPTGVSKNTLSDVLNTLFTEEQLPATVKKPDFSDGYLCKVCKDLVTDLDRLQTETIGVKKSIIGVFKKAQLKDKKKEGKRAEPVNGKKKVEQKETEESLVIEKIPKTETKIKNKAVPSNKFIANKKQGLNLAEKPKRNRKVAIIEKEGHKYLVRWENFPESEDTWELRSSIPAELIRKYEEGLEILNKSVEVQNTSGKSNAVNSPGVKDTKTPKYEKNIDKKKKSVTKQKVNSDDKTENNLDISKTKRKKKEAIIDKMGHKYLVRWENFPEEKDTWELRSAIPEEILKRYEEGLEINSSPVKEQNTQKTEKRKAEKNDEKKSLTKTGKRKSTSSLKEDGSIEALQEKKGSKYLVKWENCPAKESTWEPRSSIPDFILKYYEEDLSRLGKRAPVEQVGEDDENEFVVEAILEKRTSKKGKIEFLIKWKGYENDEDNTWEPVTNIEKHMIEDFEKNEEKIKKKIVEAKKSGQKRTSVRFSMENTEIEKETRESSRKQVEDNSEELVKTLKKQPIRKGIKDYLKGLQLAAK
eukprot:TRINITY_DN5075_c0_g1_i1.p1 TRINITY_DN5075_c0_g1~~TRINITY_DN5075_c0_g1_i1.p1  ORF type:complete len:590 (-),score=185.62 TRINITY_DN5075_c0_g1_i1:91-1860(-)